MEIENFLSKSAVKSKGTIEDVLGMHRLKKENKGILQNFYHSNQRANQDKNLMLTNKRFRDKLCSKERKYSLAGEKKSLVMVIGDRGTGVGSRIKGHRRYVGRWKQELHGRNTTMYIKNENRTSQTCVYCFLPIVHPQQRLVIKNKEVL
ncbi:hypothetical protein K501DRAFT_308610 [Backusella circina FSU 941]|nr:hypothetical protein K501DRAFT_308610 [Backusella circina FSU 941]